METKTTETVHFYGEKPKEVFPKRQYVAVNYDSAQPPTIYIDQQLIDEEQLDELVTLLKAAKQLITERKNH